MSTPCLIAATLRYCSFHICQHRYCSHSSTKSSASRPIAAHYILLSESINSLVIPLLICDNVVFPGSPPATGTGSLVIYLEDYNDNAPYVVPSVARVCEDDMNVAIVGGRDKDLYPNAAPFKIELGKQPGLDKTWKVTRVNCEYFILRFCLLRTF